MKTTIIGLIAASFFLNSHSQSIGNAVKYTDFKPFGITGGYEPGSVVTINNGKVSSPIFERSELVKNVIDKSVLDLRAPEKINDIEYDITTATQGSITAYINKFNIGAHADGTKIKRVVLRISEGESQRLNSGSVGIRKLIYELSKRDLEILLAELEGNSNVHLITEVLKYEAGFIFFIWNKNIGAAADIPVDNFGKINTNGTWINDGFFVVKYDDKQIVGYKSIKIDNKYIEFIEERLANEDLRTPLEKCFDFDINACSECERQYINYSTFIKEEKFENCDDISDENQKYQCISSNATILDKSYQDLGIFHQLVQKIKDANQTCLTYGGSSNQCRTEMNAVKKDIIDFRDGYPTMLEYIHFTFNNK